MRISYLKVFLFLLIYLTAFSCWANTPVKRHILALYSSRQQINPKHTRIHQNVEMVLNHLGCIVDYWDIDQGMPAEKSIDKYRGILSWFEHNRLVNKKEFMQWLPRQIQNGKKYVHFGSLAGFQPDQIAITQEISTTFFKTLGLSCDDDSWDDNPAIIEVFKKLPKLVEFERTLKNELPYYIRINPENKNIERLLILQKRNSPQSRSVIIAFTDWGGFALSPYIIYDDPQTFKRRWRINPFAFLARAFDLKNIPKPDVTTRNGSRIWFSHIDGDALISLSEIEDGFYCGEIIRDEILKKYNLPVSVSIVVAELLQNKRFDKIARSIFALRNVELASHSYSHPFYWDKNYAHKNEYERQHLEIPGYTFDAEKEITASIDYINDRLAPPGKKAKIFFWSGNCEPTAEAIKYCDENNILNMNGGDTVFDNDNLSYSNVAPLSVPVGTQMQYYASNSNENIYTGEWTGPFYGYLNVLKTYKNTESPRRVRPIDVYYHYYSGEKWAALMALKNILDQSIKNDIAPVFASDYLKIVQGFFASQFKKTGKWQWEVENNGHCKTIRFDHCELQPDLKKSANVIGFNKYQGSLYIHLGNAEKSRIALSEKPVTAIYLKKSSHSLQNYFHLENKIQFEVRGFGPGHFTFCNLQSGQKYVVLINGIQQQFMTNEQGDLRVTCEIRGLVKIDISIVQT
ncbi:MAG: hypothetical protein DWQ05_05075 [Calditrichaeota bacterium]|nr:MAG: hypothetical protein DWQ05_05075 [Calditrichota bacterium]